MELTRDTFLPNAVGSAASDSFFYGGWLYILGGFTSIGGVPTPLGFARINPFTDQVEAVPVPPEVTFISRVTVLNSRFYFVGQTSDLKQTGAFDLAGNYYPWDVVNNSSIDSIATDGTWIYVGGNFGTVNSQVHPRVAQIDPITALPTAWRLGTTLSGGVGMGKMVVIGTALYILGNFSIVDGQPRAKAAALAISDGSLLPFDPDVTGFPVDLLVDGANLYILGSITAVNGGGLSRTGIAKIDPATGVADAAFDAQLNAQAFSARMTGFGLAIGGSFTTASGQSRNLIAFVDPATGALGDSTVTLTSGFSAPLADFQAGKLFFGVFGDPETYLAAVYATAVIPDPPYGTPREPIIRFLNRRPQAGRPALTMFRWDAVVRDIYNNPVVADAYRVYRTSSKNLEDPVLVLEVTSLDIKGDVDTLFVEEIDGYFRYCVSAVSGGKEGRKSCANFAPTQQLERLGL